MNKPRNLDTVSPIRHASREQACPSTSTSNQPASTTEQIEVPVHDGSLTPSGIETVLPRRNRPVPNAVQSPELLEHAGPAQDADLVGGSSHRLPLKSISLTTKNPSASVTETDERFSFSDSQRKTLETVAVPETSSIESVEQTDNKDLDSELIRVELESHWVQSPRPLSPLVRPKIKVESDEQENDSFWKRGLLATLHGWLVSSCFHLIVLVILAFFVTTPNIFDTPVELVLSEATTNFEDPLNEAPLDQPIDDAITIEPEVQKMASAAPKEAESIREEFVEASLMEFDGLANNDFEAYALGDLLDETGASGEANDGGDEGGEGEGAEFFGTKAYGKRFVFVVDLSGSMAGEKWLRLVEEIIQSINVLSEDEQVLVLMYNHRTYPMLNLAPAQIDLFPATEEFKRNLFRWLSFCRPEGSTEPAHAMMVALGLNPDAIFLLSDGAINDNTIDVLWANNKPRELHDGTEGKIPVHTIKLGGRPNPRTTDLAADIMKLISRTNNGKFRWVH